MNLNRYFLAVVSAGLILGLGAGTAKASNGASVDAASNLLVTNVYAINGSSSPPTSNCTNPCAILTTTVHGDLNGHNGLVINVSAVTGMFTSNQNVLDYQSVLAIIDGAKINLKVKVDGNDAIPGRITFDSMIHYNASAAIPGFLNQDLSGQQEAHSFNFIYVCPGDPNLTRDHVVEVDAWVNLNTNNLVQNGVALTDVKTVIGKRTLIVEKKAIDYDQNNNKGGNH